MQVRDIMTEDPAYCTATSTINDVARKMAENDCGALPVIDTAETMLPIGVLTDRDIVLRALALGRDPLSCRVEDIMSGPCISVHADDDVEECCDTMEANQIRRVVVVDREGRLCGIVAQADIARAASRDKTAEVVREISL